jgi:Putative Flp pilus-assembly TadE/G-like
MEELYSRFQQPLGEPMLTRFLKNARGGVAPLMAVVAMPLIGAVGMTVDYSRVNAARAAFQVALDSTALMMSKDAPTKTDAERQTEATKTFSALFNRPEVTDATVTLVFHRGRSTWGNTRLRVALVLDDTGSMANDGKMDALKIASRNLQSGRSERTGHHCRCAGSGHAALFFALCSPKTHCTSTPT